MVQYHLDHPHVSRLHASLAVDGGRVVLADLGSSNGTFVNGQRLTQPTALKPGDRIDIGPFSLRFDGLTLVSRSRSNNIELIARGLKRVVQDRATGQAAHAARPHQPGHPPAGVRLPARSERIGQVDPARDPERPEPAGRRDGGAERRGPLRPLRGPQGRHRRRAPEGHRCTTPWPSARPCDTRPSFGCRRTCPAPRSTTSVSDILDVVGLTERRGTLIRHLSGGQVKRASLANELVARPSLLFLDEVTSGLDEQTDREVMELFRQVADGGKTVVCITHNLANVEATCHLVVILTEGGRLAFIGTPDEAKAYFEIARLGDVYRKLASGTARSGTSDSEPALISGAMSSTGCRRIRLDDGTAAAVQAVRARLRRHSPGLGA